MQIKFNNEERELMHKMLDELIDSGDETILYQKAQLDWELPSEVWDLPSEDKVKITQYRMCLYKNDR